MSVCPAVHTLDGVEGEGTGGKSALPFSSPSTLAALRRAFAEASSLCQFGPDVGRSE